MEMKVTEKRKPANEEEENEMLMDAVAEILTIVVRKIVRNLKRKAI